jgi:opacity protein-like surface antigen
VKLVTSRTLLALLIASLIGSTASAQTIEPSTSRFGLTVRGGVYQVPEPLFWVMAHPGELLTVGRLEKGQALELEGAYRIHSRILLVSTVSHIVNSHLELEASDDCAPTVACPSFLPTRREFGKARATITWLTTGARVEPVRRLGRLRPYLLAGAGVRRLNVADNVASTNAVVVPGDDMGFTFQYGAGTVVEVANFGFSIQLAAYRSRHEPNVPGAVLRSNIADSDVLLTVGVRLRGY